MRALSAVVFSALLGSCAPEVSLLDQIRSSGELRVITRNAPTTFYYGANEERFGVEYELAQAFADHLGVSLNLTMAEDDWQILPTLEQRRTDIAAAGLSATDTRGSRIAFGPSYQAVAAKVIYRMGEDRPESVADLVGSLVEVRSGTRHVGMLAAALESVPGLAWAENSGTSAEALMRRVAAGTVDYAVIDSNEYDLLRHYYPEILVGFELQTRSELAWALPKQATDLHEEVSRFFARIEATGELDQILDRYYEAKRDFDFVDQRSFVQHLRLRYPQYRASFAAAERETGIDRHLLAAIAYQESHWDAEAVSPTGVKGLMMLTASTAKEVDVADRSDPHESIMGGARYLAQVLEMFPERIPYEDRLMMAIAAYNVGFGHVEDARIITESRDGDKDSWEDVRANLPLLADESWHRGLKRGYARGTVPVQYVDNVQDYYWLLDRLNRTEIFSLLPKPKAPEPARDPS